MIHQNHDSAEITNRVKPVFNVPNRPMKSLCD